MTKRRRVTYSLDDFCNAVTAYRNKTMTSIAASKKCGVPESTIRKHKDNKTNRVGSGRPSALSVDQEQYLVALLRELQSIGVRLTREILAKITGDFMRMIKKSNKDINNPGRHWFQNFFKRNSDKLKMKKELKLERSRRDNFTEEVRSNWFSKLKGILDLNNLNARPGQIWNCDESDYASSMITCPLTTTELINKDENQDLLDTDGVWSTRNTAQIALPVDDIEDEEKPFCELTTVPIEASPFSPTTAVRSIVTSCLREMQPPPPPVTSKRVRLERRYGEEITAGSLLQELKDKKATKDAKVKQPPKKRKKDQNLTSTNNVNSSS
ncbi:unnamed protein product [Rotaria magnacalcarata]|uniref:HTH CENPB-type domain-containing protein n=1 Tax=Rotaria magnacalcarata TaxID=392030 RepID=A0A815MJV8_9BILA|nr:unnamed protein product [Rotaria magnacalcarata]